jgi:hypothetical protein
MVDHGSADPLAEQAMLDRPGVARVRRLVRWTSLGKTLIGLINEIADSLVKSNGDRKTVFRVLSRCGQRMM